jgi:RNA polymerase sigma-70 factor (ECF subfamily)
MSRTEVAVGFLEKADVIDVRESLFVERLKANDLAAHDELVLIYRDPVARIAFRVLGDSCEASDVQDEIFLRVSRNIRGLRSDLPLRTWIYRIALSEIRSRARWWRRKYRSVSLSESNSERGHDAVIRAGLLRLSRDLRIVVVLREMEGFSYCEISDVLGISIKAVSSRLARARSELRKTLLPYLSDRVEL